MCCNYVQRTCLAPVWGGGTLNFCPVVLLPQCSYLVYLRGHALEQELSPTSLYTISLFSLSARSLYSQASPALSHQQPVPSPPSSSPSLGKGSVP